MSPAEIMSALAEPFDTTEVKFKPSVVSGNRCLALAYIDARCVQDRLDEVVGIESWNTSFAQVGPDSVECRLTIFIEGIAVTKADVGSMSEQPDGGDRMKAAYSDALKRAAVAWGIGRYLYRLPAFWVDYDPVKKRIVQNPDLPGFARPDVLAEARSRFRAAKSMTELAAEWDKTSRDVLVHVLVDKDRRKKELAKGGGS